MPKRESLKELPSVDEVLRGPEGEAWLGKHPHRYVVEAVREAIERRRKILISGKKADTSLTGMRDEIEGALRHLSALSLKPLINATGIVVHTNLGRSALSTAAIRNVSLVAAGYGTIEYDLAVGGRGRRHTHIRRLLREVTGAEDGIAVNNNAGAVLLALSTLARGKEVIVSRGELIEIGGSFRLPDVMAESGAVLREVGTTNKTHLRDYEAAIGESTALLLKVHQSNYRIRGFTKEVPIGELAALGERENIPVMFDLGSGCLLDLKPLGVHTEPMVREVVESGADLITFSGDKLLGGPQAGIIVGRHDQVAMLESYPLLRALRMDKLTLAALEATLMQYVEPERAKADIPTMRMLFEEPASVRRRARRVARLLGDLNGAAVKVVEEEAYSGGGALPEHTFKTYAVSIRPGELSVNVLEERLRAGDPPVIARIREDALLLDARTVFDEEARALAACVRKALKAG
jgi:L-seryl-tRNA(Ser) seleniumtransferase